MFNRKGNLVNYWHIACASNDIKKGSSIRLILYNVPILLWRGNSGQIKGVIDYCAHKRSPLKVNNYDSNEIVCPYHGWRYSEDGSLKEIPSTPDLDLDKFNCKLSTVLLREEIGLIWIFLSEGPAPNELPVSLSTKGKSWRSLFLTKEFNTTEELLIENFIDPTHTAFTHKGIIRGHEEPTTHKVRLDTEIDNISVNYPKTKEKIGVALKFLLGGNIEVEHSDTFLLPNLVKVDYLLNDKLRFSALIACQEIEYGRTRAVIRLAYNFNHFNPIVRLILPVFAKKVLNQDYEITDEQFRNQQRLKDVRNKSIPSDVIYHKINSLRAAKIACEESGPSSSSEFKIRV